MRDQRMNDRFQSFQRLRIGKDNFGESDTVDLPLGVQYPFAECFENEVVSRSSFCDGAVREGIRVNPVGTQVLEHLADNAFPGGNIAGQTNQVFPRPSTQ